MKRLLNKRSARLGIGAVVLLALMFSPGLPWSARCRHTVKRILTKAEIRVAAWKGEAPQLVSLSGRVTTKLANQQALAGAEIEVLDSVSGWAMLTNRAGEFVLRDVIWYPKANYTLIISVDSQEARQLRVTAPEKYPADRVIALGELQLDKGCQIDVADTPGMNAASYLPSDEENVDYYRNLFAQLTAGKYSDEEKIEALNQYVAGKFMAEQMTLPHGPPKQILEHGSNSKWMIALALATLAESGHYKTRMLNLIDDASPPTAHMVTEIYYKDRWHLYDPIFGASFRNRLGSVVSYKDLRLHTNLDGADKAAEPSAPTLNPQAIPFASLYGSGFHHYYYLCRE